MSQAPRDYFTYETVPDVDGGHKFRVLQIGLTIEEAQNCNPVYMGDTGPKISYAPITELAKIQSQRQLATPEPTCSVLEQIDRSDESTRYRVILMGLDPIQAFNAASNNDVRLVVDDLTVDQWKLNGLIIP